MGEHPHSMSAWIDQAERDRRLPEALVAWLAAEGYLNMAVPKCFGGSERSLLGLLGALGDLAETDASMAWAVMVWAESQIVAARLGDARYAELFRGGPDTLIAATAAGYGSLRLDGDLVEVTGAWRFASGISHAAAVLVHAELSDVNGPRTVGVLLQRAAIEVDDAWHALGLRATASHGVRAVAARAAAQDCYELDGPPTQTATLHSHIPIRPSFALHMAAIAVGNAAAALACVASGPLNGQLATSGLTGAAAHDLGAADLNVASGRLLLDATARELWEPAASGRPVDEALATRTAAAGARIVAVSLDATLACFRACGAAAVYDSHPAQRRLRDALTISQHANVSPQRVERLGAIVGAAIRHGTGALR